MRDNISHYKKLKNMYLNANINTDIYSTTTVKIEEGYSEVGLIISKKYFHALGAIHGSIYFKLLDDAAFITRILSSYSNISLIKKENKINE